MKHRSLRLPVLSLPQLWAVASLAGVFLLSVLVLVGPNDFWWHVRVGQWIVENGHVPSADLFSYTRAGEPWAYQAWLMEVVLFLLLRAGGVPLVIVCHAALITTGYALLLRTARLRAGGDLRWAAVGTLAAAALGFDNWSVRPQMVSFTLFGLTLYLLERDGGRARWAIPPLFAVWANSHGGFVFGLGLLGTALAAEGWAFVRRRRPFPGALCLVVALSAAATLLTPLGLGMVDYVLGFLRHPVTQTMNVEFWPPMLQDRNGQVFFALLGVWIALLFVARYRPSGREALQLLLFGVLALLARRNVAWFGFVVAPTVAACLNAWAQARPARRRSGAGKPALNAALAAIIGLLLVLSLPWFRPYLPLETGRYTYLTSSTPVEAVARLRGLSPAPRVFHGEGTGSYMIWASPQVPVFIDTRFELYPLEQWIDYIALLDARFDWEAILERYGIDTLLLEPTAHNLLIDAVVASPRWQCIYADDQSFIFRRVAGRP